MQLPTASDRFDELLDAARVAAGLRSRRDREHLHVIALELRPCEGASS